MRHDQTSYQENSHVADVEKEGRLQAYIRITCYARSLGDYWIFPETYSDRKLPCRLVGGGGVGVA